MAELRYPELDFEELHILRKPQVKKLQERFREENKEHFSRMSEGKQATRERTEMIRSEERRGLRAPYRSATTRGLEFVTRNPLLREEIKRFTPRSIYDDEEKIIKSIITNELNELRAYNRKYKNNKNDKLLLEDLNEDPDYFLISYMYRSGDPGKLYDIWDNFRQNYNTLKDTIVTYKIYNVKDLIGELSFKLNTKMRIVKDEILKTFYPRLYKIVREGTFRKDILRNVQLLFFNFSGAEASVKIGKYTRLDKQNKIYVHINPTGMDRVMEAYREHMEEEQKGRGRKKVGGRRRTSKSKPKPKRKSRTKSRSRKR